VALDHRNEQAIWSQKMLHKAAIELLAVWAVAPSYWKNQYCFI